MNKRIILPLGLIAFASASYAIDVHITTTNSSTWTPIPTEDYVANGDYTIITDRNSNIMAKFGSTSASSNNYDINSIDFQVKDGTTAPQQWNIFATITTDITTAKQEIFSNTSGKNIQYQHLTYKITKGASAAENAYAVIDLNNATFKFQGGYSAQKPIFDVQANTTIKNGTLQLNSNSNLKVTQNAALSVANLSTTLTQFEGVLTPVVTVASGSKLAVSGTTVIGAETLFTGAGDYSFNDNIKVSSNGHLKIDSTVNDIEISGDGRIILDNGSITINKDAFRKTDGSLIRFATTGTADNHLYVNVATTFNRIYVGGQLNIHLSTDTSAKLVTEFETVTGENKYIIHDFVDGMIQVTNFNNVADVNTLVTAYDSTDKEITLAFDNSGWLVTAAVPEPAEWAAIFGALALGLAMYRRRK